MKKTELPRKKFTTMLNPDLSDKLKHEAISLKCSVADILEQLIADHYNHIEEESRR